MRVPWLSTSMVRPPPGASCQVLSLYHMVMARTSTTPLLAVTEPPTMFFHDSWVGVV